MSFLMGLTTLVWAAWCSWLVVIDIRTRLLPNRLIAAGLISTTTLWLITEINQPWGVSVEESVATLAFIFALFLAIALLAKGAFGMGDVKFAPLCFLIPVAFGWQTAFTAVLLSFAAASLFGLVGLMRGAGIRSHKIPFGPFMFLGALISIFLI